MRRLLRGLGIGALAVMLTTGAAFGWGTGTHVLLAEKTGLERTPAAFNEVYGGAAADVFNFLFAYPALLAALTTATHEDGAALWAGAHGQAQRGLAYGFASHNELWGADRTAHVDGLTFGQGQGYIIAKAAQLRAAGLDAALTPLGLPEPAKALMAHVLVENGIDLLLAEQYPNLGAQLSQAALRRDDAFPGMLVEAYGGLAPGFDMVAVEEWYRGSMVSYGQMLQQPPELAQQLMALLLVEQAKNYLAMFDIVLDPAYEPLLQQLAYDGLSGGKVLCAADVGAELKATAKFMEHNLEEQGISYH